MAAAQQAWPFWILICQTILNVVANIFAPTVSTVSESTKLQQSRQYLRYVYGFGIVSAFSGSAVSHNLRFRVIALIIEPFPRPTSSVINSGFLRFPRLYLLYTYLSAH